MFTGLVEELGKVKSIVRGAKSVRLTILAEEVLGDVRLGDSIAVNGTCLTVVAFSQNWFTADVMPETVDRTALVAFQPGDIVNLERPLRVGDRLGGHIVSGHIDGVGKIVAKRKNDNAVIVTIESGNEVMKYIVKKGSIAVDGISLTVVDCDSSSFIVSLIPHSAAKTTLGIKNIGEVVNLETDIIGKYVEKLFYTEPQKVDSGSRMTMDFLVKNGF